MKIALDRVARANSNRTSFIILSSQLPNLHTLIPRHTYEIQKNILTVAIDVRRHRARHKYMDMSQHPTILGAAVLVLGALGAAWFLTSNDAAKPQAAVPTKPVVKALCIPPSIASTDAVIPAKASESSTKTSEVSCNAESPAKPPPKLFVYFGSQTGTAEGFAKTVNETAKRFGFLSKIVDLEEFDGEEFEERQKENEIHCFVISTYGEGDPCDNALGFAKYLKEAKGKPLVGTRYTVFGLGNKQYEYYNAMGRLADVRLLELGGTRVYKYGEGDDDGTLQEDFNAWAEDLYDSLFDSHFGEGASIIMDHSATMNTMPEFFQVFSRLPSAPEGNVGFVKSSGRFLECERGKEAKAVGKIDLISKPYFKTNAFEVNRIVELRQGKGDDGRGSTLHVELTIPNHLRGYGTAYNLSILPENDPNQVENVARALGLEGALDDWFTVKPKSKSDVGQILPTPCTIRTALTCYCALNAIANKSFLEKISNFATNSDHVNRLKLLCSKKGKEDFHEYITVHKTSIAEVLQEFDSVRFPQPSNFFEISPRLAARDYTIASSSKVNPRTIHLVVAIADHPLPDGREFHGVCTAALKRRFVLLNQGKCVTPIYAFLKPSSFLLPSDPTIPVIMVGPGTGVAPMRALCQERQWLLEQGTRVGPAMLFFGCRRKDEDYIYAEELESFRIKGAITALYVAFSRQIKQKVYVQDLFKEQGDIVFDWLHNKNGRMFVCGGTQMGKDVHNALAALCVSVGKLDEKQAKAFMSKMSNEGNYVAELWT